MLKILQFGISQIGEKIEHGGPDLQTSYTYRDPGNYVSIGIVYVLGIGGGCSFNE